MLRCSDAAMRYRCHDAAMPMYDAAMRVPFSDADLRYTMPMQADAVRCDSDIRCDAYTMQRSGDAAMRMQRCDAVMRDA
jgi:hypothetical protein